MRAAWWPEEQLIQERFPYSMLTGREAGSWSTRCSMGLLAQARDSIMAQYPTSPLPPRRDMEEEQEEEEEEEEEEGAVVDGGESYLLIYLTYIKIYQFFLFYILNGYINIKTPTCSVWDK